MRTFLLCSALSLLGISMQAQNFEVNRNRLSHLVMGAVITPEYLTCVDESATNPNYEFEYTNRMNYGVGLDIWYGFGEKFYVKTGIIQSFRKYSRKEICYDCANGFNYESDFRLRYLDIPVGMAYKLVNSRIDFIVDASIVGSFLQSALENRNSITGSYYDYNIKPTYNNFITGFQAGLGTNYNLTYRLSIGLSASYRSYFNRVTEAVPVRWKGFTTVTGVYYKF